MNTSNVSRGSHLACLDGLKGICACIIAFCWHYRHFPLSAGFPFHRILTVSFDNGWCIVDLFFILSGLGMMIGYADRAFERRISFRDFISKRLRRLYPTFLLGTLATLLLELIYLNRNGTTFVYGYFDVYHFYLNLLLLQNGYLGTDASFDSPSWCLSICVLCYLLFYLVLTRVKKRHHIYGWFALTALIGLAIVRSGVDVPILNVMTGRGLASFSVGVLLYGVYERRDSFRADRLGYVTLALFIVSYLLLRLRPEFIGSLQMSFIFGIAPSLVLGVLFLPWLARLFAFKPLVFLGKISIAIYLFHFPVQCLIMLLNQALSLNINFSSHAMWLIYVAAVIAVAALYNLLLQKPWERAFIGFFTKKESHG